MQVEGVTAAPADPISGAPRLGSPLHLARRFFDVLGARPLGAAEVAWVAGHVSPAELTLFLAPAPADQRHGYESGRHVAELGGGSELIRAALLHDVGKRHARLGVAGRVAASVAIALRLPLRGRFAAYRDHDLLGAADLAAAGSPPAVVEHAATHHQRPGAGPAAPPALSAGDRRLLLAADEGGMRGRGRRSR